LKIIDDQFDVHWYPGRRSDRTQNKPSEFEMTQIRVHQRRLIKKKMMTTTMTAKSAAAATTTTMMTLLFVISIVVTPLFITSTIAFVPSLLRPRHSSTSTTTAATTTLATILVGGMKTKNTALAMFTGIVEEMGTVVNMEERNDMTLWDGSKGKGTELTVRGNVVMEGAYLG
jgi:hypothetical protein